MQDENEDLQDLPENGETDLPDPSNLETAPDPEAPEASQSPAEPSPAEEIQKWKDTALRAGAELENFRKRMSREKLDAMRFANQSLLEELLPIIDNFEMGLTAAEKEEGSMIFTGMKMVKAQLDNFLSSQGVKEVPTDQAFDPNFHEALSEEPAPDAEPGSILRVQRKGYLLQERLIRPAAVVLAAEPQPESSD